MEINVDDLKRRITMVDDAVSGLPNIIALGVLTGCIGKVLSGYEIVADQKNMEESQAQQPTDSTQNT